MDRSSRNVLLAAGGDPRLVERIVRFVDVDEESGCWVWTGSLVSSGGYAQLNLKREDGRWIPARVHRLTYELVHGPIPAGLVLDHLCRRPACVNPGHLEAVTDAVNIARGLAPTHVIRRRGVCSHGHVVEGANAKRRPDGRIRCVACSRQYARTVANPRAAERRRASRAA